MPTLILASLVAAFVGGDVQDKDQPPTPVKVVAASSPLSVEQPTPYQWVVKSGSQTLCAYTFAPEQIKPYVRELAPLGGENVLRDSPFDHKHHHGLMFAIKVNGVNFWEETPGCGYEKPVGPAQDRARPVP